MRGSIQKNLHLRVEKRFHGIRLGYEEECKRLELGDSISNENQEMAGVVCYEALLTLLDSILHTNALKQGQKVLYSQWFPCPALLFFSIVTLIGDIIL